MNAKPAILITGAAGGLANIVVQMLAKRFRLVGVDPRGMPMGRKFPGEFHQVDYNHRKMAEIFRSHKFDTMLHLGRVSTTSRAGRNERFNLNVLGTQNLLELAAKYHVKNVIVFSTFHVYGAHQYNHIHITESDPLRASQTFPELLDVTELDHVSRMFLLQHREIRTIILRPVNVIGPRIQNQISKMLRAEYCPVLMGYDPMLQFIHENDIALALGLCLDSDRSGVYNVAGEGTVPYTRAIEMAGSKTLPVPHFLAYPALGILQRLKLSFPKHLADYFRYPTVVSDAAFRKDFGYEPTVTTVKALEGLRIHDPESVQTDALPDHEESETLEDSVVGKNLH